MPGFPRQRRRVDDDVGAQVGAGVIGGRGQGAGPELRKGVPAAARQLYVVAGLAAAAIPDDEVGFKLPRQEIDGGAFASSLPTATPLTLR